MANDGFQVGVINQDGDFVPKGTFDYNPGNDNIVLRDEVSGDTFVYNNTAGIWQIDPSIESDSNVYAGLTEQQFSDNTGADFSALDGAFATGREANSAQLLGITAHDSNPAVGTQFAGYRSRGTIASPTVVQENDRLAVYQGNAYGGDGNYHTAADMRAQADTVTGTNNEIIAGTYRIRTRDESDAFVSRLIVQPGGRIDIETGTFQHNRVAASSNISTSGDGYYSVDSSGGAVTVTLASADATDGTEINVKRNGGNTVTVDTEGTETIDDGSTFDLAADNEAVTVVYNSDNTDWEVY